MVSDEQHFAQLRHRMVDEQLVQRGISDDNLLQAFRSVPRHLFVPPEYREQAYADTPLPIGSGQTISQPYIVAYMTTVLRLRPADHVLEVGTGSGYQAAILSCLADSVVSLECVPALAEYARECLQCVHADNVEVVLGDGSYGWSPRAPYSRILVPAAAPSVPTPLLAQMKDGGRMVVPIGSQKNQHLQLWERTSDRYRRRVLVPVRFVPLLGRWGWPAAPAKASLQ